MTSSLQSTIGCRESLRSFAVRKLDELAIAEKWRSTAVICLERMRESAQEIPGN
jgi:hypothetical protein